MSAIKISIDDILQSTAIGSLNKAVANNLYGFNHTQTPKPIPSSREQQGFVFFVRPQLNLRPENIRNIRKFLPMVSDQKNGYQDPNASLHRFVQTTLDPRIMTGYFRGVNRIEVNEDATVFTEVGGTHLPGIPSLLTNNEQAFIPILTNNLLTMSGWPDETVPVYQSKAGRYDESISFVDGLVDNYGQYTLDATFRNTIMDPIVYMFYIWTHYQSYVFSGKILPYFDFIVDRRIDYNSRIYRILLDRNKKKVTKIMSTGPVFPVATSMGVYAEYDAESALTAKVKDFSMRFQCFGFEIFDQILVYEFNTTVCMFKKEMTDGLREAQMIKVPRSLDNLFTSLAYPRIDTNSHDLEWWVDKGIFDAKALKFVNHIGLGDEGDAISRYARPDFESTENG